MPQPQTLRLCLVSHLLAVQTAAVVGFVDVTVVQEPPAVAGRRWPLPAYEPRTTAATVADVVLAVVAVAPVALSVVAVAPVAAATFEPVAAVAPVVAVRPPPLAPAYHHSATVHRPEEAAVEVPTVAQVHHSEVH